MTIIITIICVIYFCSGFQDSEIFVRNVFHPQQPGEWTFVDLWLSSVHWFAGPKQPPLCTSSVGLSVNVHCPPDRTRSPWRWCLLFPPVFLSLLQIGQQVCDPHSGSDSQQLTAGKNGWNPSFQVWQFDEIAECPCCFDPILIFHSDVALFLSLDII